MTTLDAVLALVAFSFVTSATPGPNNMMLLASGANFGWRRTMPHLFGISGGHAFLIFSIGIGLGALMQAWPPLEWLLTALSLAFLLWIAWRIATAPPTLEAREGARPLTFLQAAAFQWVNPKGWGMALAAVGPYRLAPGVEGAALTALLFASVNLPSCGGWAFLGQGLRRFLREPARLRAFNLAMAALLVATTIWILLAG